MKNLAVFCLAGIIASALSGPAYAGQTKKDNGGAWYESATEALPDIQENFGDLIRKESRRYQIPEALLTAVIAVESLGDPEVSGGLMQISPAAAKEAGVHCNTHRPVCSIRQGAAYLRHLRDAYDLSWLHVVFAYNRGPTAAKRTDNVHKYEYVQRVSFAMNETRDDR